MHGPSPGLTCRLNSKQSGWPGLERETRETPVVQETPIIPRLPSQVQYCRGRPPLELCRTVLAAAVATLMIALTGVTAFAQDPSLSFEGNDTVTVHREGERAVRYAGAIQDISGESLILRRNNVTKTQVFRLSNVTELTFVRPGDFDKGLAFRRERKFDQAMRAFDAAVSKEHRKWAKNELLATAAKTCITMGNRDQAVVRIEEILKADPRSRHASLLPLVWDERLPAAERVSAAGKDLVSPSPARQLVAASALLGDSEFRQAAQQTLNRLRTTASSRITDLADTQLWRLAVLTEADDLKTRLPTWHGKLRRLPLEARGGPQHVIARALQQQHDYDQASVAFLWLPFMSPTDEALAARSMLDGMQCLIASGRISEAATIKQELLTRFPETSAALEVAKTDGR